MKFVNYSIMSTWDVKRYALDNSVNYSNAIRLRDILNPYSVVIQKEELLKNKWSIIQKINFSGKLFLRNPNETRTFKGTLNLVESNTLIYSKINIRHGCIYYHPMDAMPFATSSEYPAFKFDTAKVSGDYLVKIIQSSYFKNVLDKKSTGISKSRVKRDDFLDVRIPLPSLSEQQALVNDYNAKINQAENLEKQAKQIEQEIEDYLLLELGVTFNNSSTIEAKKDCFFDTIRYKDLLKWSVDHFSKEKKYGFRDVKYAVSSVENYIIDIEGGKTPTTSNSEYWRDGDIYWVSAKDMKELFLEKIQDKITHKAVTESGLKIYPKNSILCVFRSGILQHSFPICITNYPVTINQDLKSIRIEEKNVLKHYFVYYLKYMQKMVLDIALKKGVTVESINIDDFRRIPFVCPPIEVQQEIVTYINNLLVQIKKLKQQSEDLRKRALEDFEKEIFE